MSDDEIRAMYKAQGYFVGGAMFNPITDSMRRAAAIFYENVTHPDAWVIVGNKRYPIADMVEYREQQ